MERFIVFIRNEKTREEFVSTYRAAAGAHDAVMTKAAEKYPQPDFRVHTAYSVAELSDMVESINRWCGPDQKINSTITAPYPRLGHRGDLN